MAKVGMEPDLGVLCWPSCVGIDTEMLRYDATWKSVVGLTIRR